VHILSKLCGYIGFYTENILISFDDERLHSAKKEYMRKEKKLTNSHAMNKDTNEEENTSGSDTDDVNEKLDEANDSYNSGDASSNDDNSDDDTVNDSSSSGDTSDDATSESNNGDTDNDDEEDDDYESQHMEDLYYNPKSRTWRDSNDTN